MIVSDASRLAEFTAHALHVRVGVMSDIADKLTAAGLINADTTAFQDAAILLVAFAAGGDPERVARIANLLPVDPEATAAATHRKCLSEKPARTSVVAALAGYMSDYATFLKTDGEEGSECSVYGLMFSRRRPLVMFESTYRDVGAPVVYARTASEPEYMSGVECWAMINGRVLREIAAFIVDIGAEEVAAPQDVSRHKQVVNSFEPASVGGNQGRFGISGANAAPVVVAGDV